MESIPDTLNRFEDELENILNQYELPGRLNDALTAYRAIEEKMKELRVTGEHPTYLAYQRVLAYCLMRQGNILRQLGKPGESMALSELEIAAARASGDQITLARSLMSIATNQIVAGQIEEGNRMLKEARDLFEGGSSYDHKQGLGWYWILQADLMNARIVPGAPTLVIEAANKALEILQPIENWPGVARAYANRAKAYERLGNTIEAAADQEAKLLAENRIKPIDTSEE